MPKRSLPTFYLEDFTPYQLAVVATAISEDLAKVYRQHFNISIAEWRILAFLIDGGAHPIAVRDIEAQVMLDRPKVSRATTRLEDAGYVEKRINATDRRLIQISLTEKGRATMAELLPHAIAYQKRLEEFMGEGFAGLQAGLTCLRKLDRG